MEERRLLVEYKNESMNKYQRTTKQDENIKRVNTDKQTMTATIALSSAGMSGILGVLTPWRASAARSAFRSASWVWKLKTVATVVAAIFLSK